MRPSSESPGCVESTCHSHRLADSTGYDQQNPPFKIGFGSGRGSSAAIAFTGSSMCWIICWVTGKSIIFWFSFGLNPNTRFGLRVQHRSERLKRERCKVFTRSARGTWLRHDQSRSVWPLPRQREGFARAVIRPQFKCRSLIVNYGRIENELNARWSY